MDSHPSQHAATVSWTGYGAPAYARLAEAIAALKDGDPLAPVTVIVPSNVCGVVARRHLAGGVGGRQGVAGLGVLTIDRLAERIAAPALVGAGRRPATNAVLAAAWRGELAGRPGVFAPVADHPATVRALVRAHRELRDVDVAGQTAIAGAGPVAADLVRLHRAVVDRLAAFYDVADLRREAVAQLTGQPGLRREIGSTIAFLPQDLRAGAVALLRALQPYVIIAGRTGDDRADDAVVRTIRQLAPSTVHDVMNAPPAVARAVLHASDSDDEVRTVVRRVVTTLRTTPAHRVGVLYGAADPYARLLAEHLAAAGLARNGAGVRPTIERSLSRLLLDLLALPDHGWRRDEVLSVIARATVRTSDDRRLPAARWERLSRDAGVVAGDDWNIRLTDHATQLRRRASEVVGDSKPADAARRRLEYEAVAAEDLRGFVGTLRAHQAAGAALRSWPELSRWAAAALAMVAGDLDQVVALPEEEARAARTIESIIAGLAGLASVERIADLAALRGALELDLADDLPRVGRLGQGLLVAPIGEAVGLDLDVVYVVGLADDLVPGRLDVDALLPEHVRALTGGQLPPPRERIDRLHRHLLAAFAAAPECVVSVPRGDLRRSAARLPSRWLVPTLRAVSGRDSVDASTWLRTLDGSPSFAAGLAEASELATEQEWRTRAAAAAASRNTAIAAALPDDPVLRQALELARARRGAALTRFDGDLSGHDVPVPVEASPTALESWARCPHGYFMERLLGVRPLESPEQIITVGPLVVGSIVHYSLDELHRRHPDLSPDQPWTARHREELRDITRTIAADFTARGLTGHPLLWERALIRILGQLDLLLAEDNRVRVESGRRQVRSELSFGLGGDPALPLNLPSGRTIAMRGSADRVDLAGESIVVVDYKTGRSNPFRDLSAANPTGRGTKLQLPIYARAARVALGRPDAPVQAEYWFTETNDRIGVPLTDEVDRIFLETLDVIVSGIADGLFPHHPPAEDGYAYIPCRYCDPDGLGAAEHRGRWQRKRNDPRLAAYRALVEPDALADGHDSDQNEVLA
jgi:ATP-dependent helicase/nuclease subunit B